MNYQSRFFLPLFVFVLAGCVENQDLPADVEASSSTHDEHTATWSYDGDTGPEHWGTLESSFATCSTGQEQSPIALTGDSAEDADLAALAFTYGEVVIEVSDTGHGFKATPEGSNTLTIGDDSYSLLQFHAHTPSEHTLNGNSFPMEVHFVHQNEAGNLAVVGVLIEAGEENTAYEAYVTQSAGATDAAETIDLAALLPAEKAYMTYDGSLTTPPCTEGVRWIVLSTPITMSDEQIEAFSTPHGITNRPVQPVGERVVTM